MAASTSGARLASVSGEDFEELLKNKDAEDTLKATKQAVHVLSAYLTKENLLTNFERVDKLTLASVLSKFYVEYINIQPAIVKMVVWPCHIKLLTTLSNSLYGNRRYIINI